jgi:hypothetical protein
VALADLGRPEDVLALAGMLPGRTGHGNADVR